MGISKDKRLEIGDWEIRRANSPIPQSPNLPISQSLIFFLYIIILPLLFSACASTPPITKIGLLAPFEGLYRESGYAALVATRAALADGNAPAAAILPLALDDGDRAETARRSGEKLLIDPQVAAVVGPLTPWAAAGAAVALADETLWLTPFALTPETGFVDPRAGYGWADAWVAATAQAMQARGAVRLILAGRRAGWPAYSAEEWAAIAAMPVLVSDEPTAVAPGDAVLWLGDGGDGAAYLNALRVYAPQTPFWTGMHAATSVFIDRAESLESVYWTIWAPVDYNPAIAPGLPDASPAQLVYLATQAALNRITASSLPLDHGWQLQIFDLSSGRSVIAH
ncbi:MAG: hypothetical protein KDD92_10160 [Caldilineaceae bacterium]|nr:hypothetical protein [Caldilineaceae bacterium]